MHCRHLSPISSQCNAHNGDARGIIVFSKDNDSSKSLATDILDEVKSIAPTESWRSEVKGSGNYGETTRIQSDSILIEYAFHDNPDDAKWIMDNITELGKLTAQGIVNNLLQR